MKLVIMQPYLFPYLGYFQLIHSADKFVVYDDVAFIKQAWINRNYILHDVDGVHIMKTRANGFVLVMGCIVTSFFGCFAGSKANCY